MMLQYLALFQADRKAGGFVVTFPDLPWGVTQGDTEAEALMRARDVLKIVLADCIERNLEIPEPGRHRRPRYHMISLPVLQEAKVLLYNELRKAGMRKAELGRRLGIPAPNVDRLFDLNRRSRLDHLESAFEVLGRRLRLELDPRAA